MVVTTTPRTEIRTVHWDHPDAAALRDAMTAEISPRYADRQHSMPVPAGMAVLPEEAVWTGVARQDGRPVGHVALRVPRYPGAAPADLEIKRMYVHPAARGGGIGLSLLAAAELAAATAGARRVVLQTGDRQPEAAALYAGAGYTRIPLFEPYFALPYSLCFEKLLTPVDLEN